MTQDIKQIPVPTNGTGPHKVANGPATPAGRGADTDADPATASGAAEAAATAPTGASSGAFSPTQLAVGFGVIAGLILLIAGRRRNRGK